MGEMFYRGQPMSEIRKADYDDLKYFYEWSRQISRTETQAANNAGKPRGK
jgi:hypothetical protein